MSGFALAAVAPLLWRARPGVAVASFALLPLLLTAWFLSLAPDVLSGEAIRETIDWVPRLGMRAAFSLDGLSLLFCLLISGIGCLVVVYADRYLAGDPQLGRFHAMLLAFMASMLGLVLADDLILVVVFWGLTGVTSFLLIGYEHARATSRASATQALIVTAAGELAMLAGVVLLGQAAGTLGVSEIVPAAEAVREGWSYPLIVLLILAGAVTKSAQFPFHFWLPNAMAAPAPVSAYLHSATMVTAGVYLALRLTPILGGTQLWSVLLVSLGSVTLLMGVLMSLRERDLKRILAYSTVGALGLMILLVGIGSESAVGAAAVLLLAHALYKGALFLVSGAIDHETGTRDVEHLSGLARAMPATALAGVLAALSMAGIPPLLGFAAKELSLKSSLTAAPWEVILVAVVVAGGAGFVAVAVITGAAPFLGRRAAFDRAVHEAAPALWLAPFALGVIALVFGLMPDLGAGRLVSAAAGSIVGHRVEVSVKPWYGIDEALLMSTLSLLLGALVIARRAGVRLILRRLDAGRRLGPEHGYELLEKGTNRLAVGLTGVLQNGRLRIYILTVTATMAALAWGVLLGLGGVPGLELSVDVRLWELGAAGAIAGGAFVAVRAGSRLSAAAALGVVGYGIALVYLLFGAPDLAMAQILIETLTIVLFVLVFYHLPRFRAASARSSRLRDATIALLGGGLLTIFVLAAGDGPHDPISGYFLDSSKPEGHGRNVVNVILVDFRALDTLGEIAVLSLAGFGVYALLKLRARSRGRPADRSRGARPPG